MEEITLDSLIQEHELRINNLRYKPDPPHCFGFAYYYYDDDNAYKLWLAKVKRYIGIHFNNDKDVAEFETISRNSITPEQQRTLLAILKALAILPIVVPEKQVIQKSGKNKPEREAINVTTNINNSNSQTQNQQQSLAIDLILNVIKDDLTGRQIKELKEVVIESDNDLEKARPGVVEKLKSFGADVASNIVANILTNPTIWGGL